MVITPRPPLPIPFPSSFSSSFLATLFTRSFQRRSPQIYIVSNVHCRHILVQNFHNGVQALRTSHPAHYPVLKRLADLFALYWVEQARAPRASAAARLVERMAAC